MADNKQAQVQQPAAKKDVAAKKSQDIMQKVQDYAQYLQVIYLERGFEPFKVPVLAVTGIIFCLYFFMYKPIEPKLMELNDQLETQRAIHESLGEYNETKNTIGDFKKKLPMYKDKEDWLNYIIISTAKEMEIELDSLDPQVLKEEGSFAIASRNLETTVEYDIAGRWIEKLENAPVFIRLTNVTMEKVLEDPAYVKLKMTVTTLFLKD
jgi:hypothetical protein